MILRKTVALFLFLSLIATPSWAYWVWSPEEGKFVNPEGSAQDSADEQYDYAMQFYREKNLDEAAKQLTNLLEKAPSAAIAPEAQYRLGTIAEENGDFLKAFEAYKKLINSYPQSERFTEVIEREFRIGNVFLSGRKAKLMGLEVLPSLPKAVMVFSHIVEHAPYSAFGDQAQFHLGLAHKQAGHFADAVEAFDTLIEQYPQSELVPKARFQLAEVSFEKSSSQFRDQRALDEASEHVSSFLARYPEGEVSEKAAKIRQVIDEKNAEKNYRTGLYYEKQNYLKSALIYFEDVSQRYEHTKWGQKAKERLRALEKPAEYLSGKVREVQEKKQAIEDQLNGLSKGDKEAREKLLDALDKIESAEKNVGSQKKEIIRSRELDIRRRERELKQKFKNLDSKRKKFADNDSADFRRAMERWQTSLMSEQEALLEEKEQLAAWRQDLGLKEKKQPWENIPFLGEGPSDLEKVRGIKAKELYKVSEEKQDLFGEKEELYKKLDEVGSLLRVSEVEELGVDRESSKWLESLQLEESKVKEQQAALKVTRGRIESLEEQLEEKRKIYEENFGRSTLEAIVRAPADLVVASTELVAKSVDRSIAFLNPFDGSEESLEDKDVQELLEMQMHLKEKIAAQQNITDTLGQAFDAELALKEQRRLLASMGETEEIDVHALRKSIKTLEKQIRQRYEEIGDRHERKKELVDELEALLKSKYEGAEGASKAANVVTMPAKATGRFVRNFIFGVPDKSAEVTEEARLLPANARVKEQASALEERIELESLMIEGKGREIRTLDRELETLKAKASLAGGYKFRSSIVSVPYNFIGNAIQSAKKVIPHKDREEVLINRLAQETEKLKAYRTQLASITKRVQALKAGESAAVRADDAEQGVAAQQNTVSQPAEKANPKAPNETKIKSEIEHLVQKIGVEEELYKREKDLLKHQIKLSDPEEFKKNPADRLAEEHRKSLDKRQKELQRELEKIQDGLKSVINAEAKLEQKESEILERRITHIDKVMKNTQSRAISQDLLTERDRMEERLSQIQLRRDFLAKEMERFQFTEGGAAAS